MKMSSWGMVRFRLRELEIKSGVKRGGHRFWLFVFNCFVSLLLVCVVAGLINWILFVLVVVGVAGVVAFFDVTSCWNGLVEGFKK